MAHPCCICGSECYCHGDIDDVVVSKTPKGCIGCDNCREDEHHAEEEFDEDDEDDWETI